MNKTHFALAIASGFSMLPAIAAGDAVTIYGQMNLGLVFDKNAYGTESTTRIDNLYTSSRLGFKGEEALANGIDAWFKLEQNVKPDTAGATSTAFASREGWVGAKGKFGSLALGRGKTGYQLASEMFDIFDAVITLDITGNMLTFMTKSGSFTNSLARGRFDNAVKYSYNTSPWLFSFDYGFGEDKTATLKATQNYSFSAGYTFKPFWVVGAYNTEKNMRDSVNSLLPEQVNVGSTLTVIAEQKNALLLGGGWNYQAFGVGLAYQNETLKGSNSVEPTNKINLKQNNFLLSASYQIGSTALKAGVILGGKFKDVPEAVSENTGFTRYVLGAKHNLSKRTAVLAEYGVIKAKKEIMMVNKKNPAALAFAIMHSF